MASRLCKENIESYERDGAVCLRQALAPEWIALLNRGVDRNIANPGPYFTDFTDKMGGGRCIKDDFCWERIPEYEEFVRRSPCAEIVGRLMRAEEVCFIEDQYFQKEAGAPTPTPWHQDQPYYELKGEWCVSWIPLDPVATGDSLRVVAGSHKSGKLYTPRSFAGAGGAFDIDQRASPLEAVPDVDVDPERYRILAWAMEASSSIRVRFTATAAIARRDESDAFPCAGSLNPPPTTEVSCRGRLSFRTMV
jgi:hypothetical protein